MIYWDTSCVLKLYVEESDSEFWTDIAENSSDPVFSSAILKTEMCCALYSLEARGMLKKGRAENLCKTFKQDIEHGLIVLMPVGDDVLEQSEKIAKSCHALQPPIPIRSLDAVHVATCKLYKCKSIATTDQQMKKTVENLQIAVLQ